MAALRDSSAKLCHAVLSRVAGPVQVLSDGVCCVTSGIYNNAAENKDISFNPYFGYDYVDHPQEFNIWEYYWGNGDGLGKRDYSVGVSAAGWNYPAFAWLGLCYPLSTPFPPPTPPSPPFR